MSSYIVEVHATPKSLNRTRYAHWRAASRENQLWQEQIGTGLMVAGVPRRLQFVQASAQLRFHVKRKRRDEGNFRTPIEKALGDILVAGGWLPDDTPDHFRFGSVGFEEETGPARTTIYLETLP